MNERLDILRLRVLLSFYNEDPALCTVTGLSNMLSEGKQRVSRVFSSLEKDGLLTRRDPRHPKLTERGKEEAAYYEQRVSTILNHLLYEGVDIADAENDSYAWALDTSDGCMKVIADSEQRYHAKYNLRRQTEFDGGELCRHLGDGVYAVPFLFYRESAEHGSNLSMANGGFVCPCELRVQDHIGTIRLQTAELSAKSQSTGQQMTGRIRSMEYMEQGEFHPAQADGDCFLIPARALSFLNLGSGTGQVLHGSVCLRMQCSVGTRHMPESTVIFTILF